MNIYTIGFTKKSAEDFFTRLSKSGAKKVVDIRLNNASQLAGFAKGKDLKYFLKSMCDIDYEHRLDLAPTKAILDEYKKGGNDWAVYTNKYNEMIVKRKIETNISSASLDQACLLCSEDKPDKCHRRLLAEYLQDKWADVTIIHL